MKLTHERELRQQRKYNVTPEAWRRVMDHQHGRCAICKKKFNGQRLPCIDHQHETGLWRGLLCTDCNYDVGMHHDNADWFQAAATYLVHPPAEYEHIYVPGSPGAAGVLDVSHS